MHEDDYYQCITCDMGAGYSICTTCIKICHAKHEVKYVARGEHYCDCGEKGEKSCKALKSKSNIWQKNTKDIKSLAKIRES